MAGDAAFELLIIGVGRILERDTALAHGLDGGEDVVRAERDVLDTLAAVVAQELLDLGMIVPALVQGNADLAAGTGHGLGDEARLGCLLDIEIADFAEVEDALVELGPPGHLAAMDVVRQVVEIGEAEARDRGRGALDGREVHIVDGLGPIAVDQIEVRAADPLDGRDVQLHRTHQAAHLFGAALERQAQGLAGVAHAKGHGVGRGPVAATELRGLAGRLHVEDEVDVALGEAQHVLGAVPRYGGEAHQLEQALQPLGLV